MTTIDKIVNLKKHPINSLNDYVIDCYNKINKKYILQLDSFLTEEAVKNIKIEADNLKHLAYYCSQFHTILLNKKDKNLNDKISRISRADLEDGGEGAIYIFLKNNKKFKG